MASLTTELPTHNSFFCRKTNEALQSQVRNFEIDIAEVKQEKARLLSENEQLKSEFSNQVQLKKDQGLSHVLAQLEKEILDKTKKLEEAQELARFQQYQVTAQLEAIKIVTPPLRHLYALRPVLTSMINTTDRITVSMRERALNRV